jgi:hypothetical protein
MFKGLLGNAWVVPVFMLAASFIEFPEPCGAFAVRAVFWEARIIQAADPVLSQRRPRRERRATP